MPKAIDSLVKFWPVLAATVAVLWGGGSFVTEVRAGMSEVRADRTRFERRLDESADYNARVTVLLEKVVPDYRERLARVEERVRALEERPR